MKERAVVLYVTQNNRNKIMTTPPTNDAPLPVFVDPSEEKEEVISYTPVPVFRATDSVTSVPVPPTGDMAYCAPPIDPLAARFGYNAIQVKKPMTYWSQYRKYPHWSWRHLGAQVSFLMATAYVITMINEAIRTISDENASQNVHTAGEALGKQQIPFHKRKAWTQDQVDDLATMAQASFIAGKEFTPKQNYDMVKIKRPNEMTYDDVRKR